MRKTPLAVGSLLAVLCHASGGAAHAQTVETQTGLSPRQVLIRVTSAAGDGAGVSNIGQVIADLVGLEVSTAPIGSSAGVFGCVFGCVFAVVFGVAFPAAFSAAFPAVFARASVEAA